jgi:hypothetical protein
MATTSYKRGVLMQPRLDASGNIVLVKYDTNPYQYAVGVIRSIQKFSVVLLTTKGTDPIRPWFGTLFSSLLKMNITNKTDLDVFVNDQVDDAKNQFFTLQNEDTTLIEVDRISNIKLVSVELSETGAISVTIRFYASSGDSVTISVAP